jgi:hypothetical protein
VSHNYPSNNDDVIDSRSIIERIEELRAEVEEQRDADIETENEAREDAEEEAREEWEAAQEAAGTSEPFPGLPVLPPYEPDKNEAPSEEAAELAVLEALQEQCEGYCDWKHGATLVRDDYFPKYAQQFAEDCGDIVDNGQWPYTCIDWQAVAEELQEDYTSVDFDGVTYWIR